jgi:serine palmitoyltransferase
MTGKVAEGKSSQKQARKEQHEAPPVPWFTAVSVFFGYGLLLFFGHLRDFFGNIFKNSLYKGREGYAPLLKDFEDFYTRRLYHRIRDCWNRPITGCAGAHIDVLMRDRDSMRQPLYETGEIKSCLNLGSYNYLGFGNPNSPTKPHVLKAVAQYSTATTSNMPMLGTTRLHADLEELVARFVGKDAAMVFGMGFGTNSTAIPAMMGKGSLIISDSMNHSSIVCGARASGAKVKVFKHNSAEDLESVVRQSIVDGQPRTHRPWKKIMIIVEGIYSMEGEICPLPDIVAIKKKYNCYLFVDEAHSIGALGNTGRGIAEHHGVDPQDIDILMGTFTKSFGAVGGYIASSKPLIKHLHSICVGSLYSQSISPPAAQQVISAFKIIMGEDGTNIGQEKIASLRRNSNFFRTKMTEMGCHVLGDEDSPVIPTMLYNPAKIPAFSRECLARDLAVVVVGFPASPLLLSRARFCISAAHTIEELEEACKKISEVAGLLGIKYAKNWPHL